ncbi:PREDICTED: fasciclin-like arabinogalactan protein 1 [Ipomoea nil]|uniref:fasciclin-like arabinogalactan protein 1 n=1 Tax=Ipomoea nil TaxID=35883 RepID=UPI0009010880|nr:PREDICTED: fasciclin-like arabinogalactan protein 1 [Ipomoea nil]
MQLFPPPAAAAAVFLSLALLLLPSATEAYNITAILAKYKEFSTFNHYLSLTHLAADINSRDTITVCAVDDAAMADLLAKHHSIYTIKNVLSLHVLLDYYGAKKLHQLTNGTALAATMFQATGSAPGAAGFVNITDLKGGKVGFGPQGDGGALPATFVKAVEEIPYNISIIHISSVLPSAAAEAPAPEPSKANITKLMSAHGCKLFADTLLGSPAEKTFEDNIDGGLTIFCPGDGAMKSFMPKFKNLTKDQKESLLEYHGVPVYQPLNSLRSNNGDMNTLATDGADNFQITVQNDGQDVTLKTKIDKATVTGTLSDQQPLVILTVDKVLMPKELFKPAAVPTPAPAPAPEADDADSPEPAGKKHKSHKSKAADSPADSPDGDVADQKADDNGAVGFTGGRFITLGLSLWFAFLLL